MDSLSINVFDKRTSLTEKIGFVNATGLESAGDSGRHTWASASVKASYLNLSSPTFSVSVTNELGHLLWVNTDCTCIYGNKYQTMYISYPAFSTSPYKRQLHLTKAFITLMSFDEQRPTRKPGFRALDDNKPQTHHSLPRISQESSQVTEVKQTTCHSNLLTPTQVSIWYNEMLRKKPQDSLLHVQIWHFTTACQGSVLVLLWSPKVIWKSSEIRGLHRKKPPQSTRR